MLKVSFANSHNYFVTKNEVITAVKNKIKNGVIEVALLNKDEMPKPDGKLHNILSYTASESEFVHPVNNYLGEILICYPLAGKNTLALIEHGCSHLLGDHHD